MAAPAAENTTKPRMIQSAVLIVIGPTLGPTDSLTDDSIRDPNDYLDHHSSHEAYNQPGNDASARRLDLQLASRQLAIRLEVLFARPPRNFLGKGRRGRLFVPANFFEVIAHILLVVGILHLARLITVDRPKARGIR